MRRIMRTGKTAVIEFSVREPSDADSMKLRAIRIAGHCGFRSGGETTPLLTSNAIDFVLDGITFMRCQR